MFYGILALSFIIVALGQPVYSNILGVLTYSLGLSIFWGITLAVTAKKRFWLATFYMMGVQLIQLYWFISHPYLYIYALWILLSFGIGLTFGWVTTFVTLDNLKSKLKILAIASFATLLEWGRLFILSGFSWNPIGIAPSGNIYLMQFSSLLGVYGLSFWVYLSNLFLLKAYYLKSWKLYFTIVSVPLLFGLWQLKNHDQQRSALPQTELKALLVQTAFPIEETLVFKDFSEYRKFVVEEWKSILNSLKPHQGKDIDLIVLPEYVVPFGTYTPVFEAETIKKLFHENLSDKVVFNFPYQEEKEGVKWVSNADIIQTISNHFGSDVIAGLEDAEYNHEKELDHFSSAFLFEPFKPGKERRYDKRVLVPMGEYIPFKFCRDLAKSYGICGSFKCGEEAKVFEGKVAPFGLSICYEETYANLMRENRLKGAQFLVNLTSDVWYPNSLLPEQHRDHARLRSVEGGYPLLRACNTGVTCAIDSMGRTIDEIKGEWERGALYVKIPLYSYQTLYTQTGDQLLIGFCLGFIGLSLLRRKLKMH